jgi:hypothetical protein
MSAIETNGYHEDMWRPSAITEYASARLEAAAIEEFMVDPTELIKDWFDDFILVRHRAKNSLINPPESLTNGLLPRQDTFIPVQFMAVMPGRSVIIAGRLFGREATGKVHGWYHREVQKT